MECHNRVLRELRALAAPRSKFKTSRLRSPHVRHKNTKRYASMMARERIILPHTNTHTRTHLRATSLRIFRHSAIPSSNSRSASVFRNPFFRAASTLPACRIYHTKSATLSQSTRVPQSLNRDHRNGRRRGVGINLHVGIRQTVFVQKAAGVDRYISPGVTCNNSNRYSSCKKFHRARNTLPCTDH